ncbi:hypothetical protein AGABI1DRAFT_116376 [Agaricus bisporus var. burnettii JB137-S8]|uniref:Uncharacterized protein n=1 Tax=Agaricus bisporus var. burnettii (strain JB137-S8 / ATCC MYA-4627 / FGSC 10392) TaxID=597362 RepID=K5WX83_AGABU|nr:uncharacterized protein AGABI1DRAFT_116376 [Agaricus bisporus var. burnettii JB137-S8]EKM75433.1 hypothetical protein AGABI1DRAFT_116376 [Agaricus bisporus var. burnettii JB137-S8]
MTSLVHSSAYLEFGSTKFSRDKEKACGGRLLAAQMRHSKRSTGRAEASSGPVDCSNRSKKHIKQNDSNFRHQLMLVDQRLSALERDQGRIRINQDCISKKQASIRDKQDIVRNQQVNIARDQERIACDYANIKKEFDDIGREQGDIERGVRDIRLEQEDLENGFANTRRKIAKNRRSLEDIRERMSVVAEDQARISRKLESDDETCETFLRALDVFNRVIVEDEGLVIGVYEHFM